MPDLRLIGRFDHNVGWADGRLVGGDLCEPDAPVPDALLGAVAGVGRASGGRHRLLRDPLGLNKLFWSGADDTILVAARPIRLVAAGCPFETIRAFPPGTVVDLDLDNGSTRTALIGLGSASPAPEPPDGITALAIRIRSRFESFFEALARANAGIPSFVCLSGGLDSAGIAVLAREYLPGVTAVSFDVRRSNGRTSEDRRTAERLAGDLGIPLLEVTVTADEILDTLDGVLTEAIDWRDFNVHAGLVNACLARAIAAAQPGGGGRSLVLTGDLANEFLVDYHAESYGGQSFYRLPRVPPATLRALLVRGLETSHREIGPFEACDLRVALPYAAAADLYLALPPEFLEVPDRKERLSRLVHGTRIPEYVYARPKTRAQVGDPDTGSGVLSICADCGRDAQWLRRRFAELHGVADLAVLDRFIRGGRYRAAIPQPEGAPV